MIIGSQYARTVNSKSTTVLGSRLQPSAYAPCMHSRAFVYRQLTSSGLEQCVCVWVCVYKREVLVRDSGDARDNVNATLTHVHVYIFSWKGPAFHCLQTLGLECMAGGID